MQALDEDDEGTSRIGVVRMTLPSFSVWLENQITSANELPPIPNGCTRATNFTNPTVGPKLLSGQPFLYGRGMITSTTDPFSNNQDVWSLLTTGKTGAWDRNSFGNQVVILDIPSQEYRQHMNPTLSNGKVDNSRVLGVFDRTTGVLTKNTQYNPSKPVEPMTLPNRMARFQPPGVQPPVPNTSSAATGEDVW